jgi:hypothetical protein
VLQLRHEKVRFGGPLPVISTSGVLDQRALPSGKTGGRALNLSLRFRLYAALVVLRALNSLGLGNLVLTAAIAGYTMNLRCPVCNVSVILDATTAVFPQIPNNCRNCGYPLT